MREKEQDTIIITKNRKKEEIDILHDRYLHKLEILLLNK